MSRSVLLRAGHMVDVEAGRLLDDVAVIVEGHRIARVEHSSVEVPDGAEVIDLGSLTLMPGLIDAHMHFWGADCSRWQDFFFNSDGYGALWSVRDATDLLRAGFTSVRCCGGRSGPEVSRAITEGLIEGPRVLAAGQFIMQRGGTWDPHGVPEEVIRAADLYADGVEECRRVVRRRIRGGSQFIKIGLSSGQVGDAMPGWGDDPYNLRRNFSLGEVRAMREEAHNAGVQIVAHAIGDAAVNLALDGELDTIEHAHGINDETRRKLAQSGTIVNATLSAQKSWIDHGEEYGLGPELLACSHRHFNDQVDAFARSLELGVRYALGSDSIGPPLSPHAGNVGEYELAVKHGMHPSDALRAGLMVGAAVFGAEHDLGSVAPSRLADIIGVRGNPLDDISSLRRVSFVMKDGRVHRRDHEPGDVSTEGSSRQGLALAPYL